LLRIRVPMLGLGWSDVLPGTRFLPLSDLVFRCMFN
jgi:hypothetical protein